jgi:hypothetical protein
MSRDIAFLRMNAIPVRLSQESRSSLTLTLTLLFMLDFQYSCPLQDATITNKTLLILFFVDLVYEHIQLSIMNDGLLTTSHRSGLYSKNLQLYFFVDLGQAYQVLVHSLHSQVTESIPLTVTKYGMEDRFQKCIALFE